MCQWGVLRKDPWAEKDKVCADSYVMETIWTVEGDGGGWFKYYFFFFSPTEEGGA